MFEENKKEFISDFGRKLKFILPCEKVIDKDSQGDDLLGIFDLTHTDSSLGYQAVKNSKPRLTCVYDDVREVVRNSVVIIEGVETQYKVFSNEDDGTGFAVIELTR